MKKSTLSVIIGLALGLLLIILWLYCFDLNALAESLKKLKPGLVIIAGLFYVAAYFIRSVRWNLLLRNQVALSVRESWLIACAGNWLNYLIPIRAGELVKALLIKKLKKCSAVSILPSVFIDKFFDTLGIFAVLVMIPMLGVRLSPGLKTLIITLIVVFSLAIVILLMAAIRKKSVARLLQVVFIWLPKRWRSRIDNLIELFIDGLNIFGHHYSILLYCILITALGMGLDGLYFWFVFRAFGLGTAFMVVLFGYTLINLSYILPQPPAQLGSNEWMMIIIFSLGFGIDKNAASAVMVFAHLFTAVIISLLGLAGFSYAGVRTLGQIKREI